MKNRDVLSTILILGIFHVCLIILTTMIFGLNHPLGFLYRELFPYVYILAVCVLAIPPYVAAGYLFILAKNKMHRILDSVWTGCAIFTAFLVVIWCISYVLTMTGWDPEAWTYYVIANYPLAFAMNVMDLSSNYANNPAFVLLSLVPGLAFYLGAKIRVRVIKGVGVNE